MNSESVDLGWVEGKDGPRKFSVAPAQLFTHSLISGPTGCGKSMGMLSLATQVALRHSSCRILSAESKGEFSRLLRRTLSVLSKKHPRIRPANLLSVAPFHGYATAMNPFARVPGLSPKNQAAIVSELFCSIFEGVGDRMRGILYNLCHICILIGGSLITLARILVNDAYRLGVVGLLSDADAREYLVHVLPQQPDGSRLAIHARLGLLLVPDAIRGPLCAKGTISNEMITETPFSIFDFSGAPFGHGAISQFLGSWLWTRMAGAVLSRQISKDSGQFIGILDELGESLRAPGLVLEASRMLEQARWRKANFVFCVQSQSQAQNAGQGFYQSLKTNCAWRMHYSVNSRTEIDDVLPFLLTGQRVDPSRPDRLLGTAEEKEAVMRDLLSLAPRQLLYVDRRVGTARLLTTLTVPYAEIEKQADALSPETHEAWMRGGYGQPLAELLANPADPQVGGEVVSSPGASSASPTAGKSGKAKRLRLVVPS